jgi:hypothetical protein
MISLRFSSSLSRFLPQCVYSSTMVSISHFSVCFSSRKDEKSSENQAPASSYRAIKSNSEPYDILHGASMNTSNLNAHPAPLSGGSSLESAAQDLAGKAKDKIKQTIKQAGENVRHMADQVSEQVLNHLSADVSEVDKIKQKVQTSDIGEKIREKTKQIKQSAEAANGMKNEETERLKKVLSSREEVREAGKYFLSHMHPNDQRAEKIKQAVEPRECQVAKAGSGYNEAIEEQNDGNQKKTGEFGSEREEFSDKGKFQQERQTQSHERLTRENLKDGEIQTSTIDQTMEQKTTSETAGKNEEKQNENTAENIGSSTSKEESPK